MCETEKKAVNEKMVKKPNTVETIKNLLDILIYLHIKWQCTKSKVLGFRDDFLSQSSGQRKIGSFLHSTHQKLTLQKPI